MVNGNLPDFAALSNSAIKKTFHLHFKVTVGFYNSEDFEFGERNLSSVGW